MYKFLLFYNFIGIITQKVQNQHLALSVFLPPKNFGWHGSKDSYPLFWTPCFPIIFLLLTIADTDNTPCLASPVKAMVSDHMDITSSGKTVAQEFYICMNCLLKALVLLCHGLLNSNMSPLSDETTALWKSMKVLS